MNLNDFLDANNIDYRPIFDGKIHRFQGNSRKGKSGWMVGTELNGVKYLLIGDFALGSETQKWSSQNGRVHSAQLRQILEDTQDALIAERLAANNEAAAMSEKHLSRNQIQIGVEQFEYCLKKKISSLYGAEFCEDQFGPHIAVPLCDVNGKIWSVQKIYSDGHKMFMPGGRKKGCFFKIGDLHSEIVFICEGFATAVAIHESTKMSVVVAFDAGNLVSACLELKAKFPLVRFVVAADNDQFNKENAGLKAAQNCKVKAGFEFVYPEFSNGLKDKRPTDFNDLFILSGSDEVKRQCLGASSDANLLSEEYLMYKNFFEMLYPTVKKCFLTGEVTYLNGKDRTPILNEVKRIKAEALGVGLPESKVENYLAKWTYDMSSSWLVEIEKWNGEDNISKLLSYLEVENLSHEHFVELMKEWLVGIFSRVENNHHQNKMVIFGGVQGAGKDTFIENMLSGLRPYFTSAPIHDKETENYGVMTRRLVLNIAEFDRTSKIHVSQLKNIITASEATFRAPYAVAAQTVKFRTSFISSVNPGDIFRDTTGNRRYMFFKVKAINWDYPKDLSVQIIAQAKVLFEQAYQPSSEATEAMRNIIQMMTPDDPEVVIRELWLKGAKGIWDNRPWPSDGSPKRELEYADIKDLVREIALDCQVGVRTVQSFLKMNYQKSDGTKRYYAHGSLNTVQSYKNNAENVSRVVENIVQRDA